MQTFFKKRFGAGLIMVILMTMTLTGCFGTTLNLADILSFDLLDSDEQSVKKDLLIDVKNKSVICFVEDIEELTGEDLLPLIEVADGYQVFHDGILHKNGESAYDFSQPLEFTVTKDNEKKQTKVWTVALQDPYSPLVAWTFDDGIPAEMDIHGDVTLVDGKHGQGVLLKGFGPNQYLTVDGGFVANKLVFPDNTFTLETWFYLDSEYATDGWNAVFSTGGTGAGNVRLLIGGHAAGLANQLIYISADGIKGERVVDWLPNQWHHFAYTYDGSDLLVYFDGELVFTEDGSLIEQINFSADEPGFYIGVQHHSNQRRNFGGIIDELIIYDYARSGEQILASFER